MPTQTLTLKIAGLHSSPNPYSETPEGALVRADNIVIDQNSVAELRRGFDVLGGSFPAVAQRLIFFRSRLFESDGTNLFSFSSGGGGTWSNLGAFSPPASRRMRDAQSNSNLYLTSANGVLKMANENQVPQAAGVPKALDVTAALSGSSPWLGTNSRVAYRVVWGIRDANQNLVVGVPSQRALITTAGAAQSVTLTVSIPVGVTTSHFLQVYRSSIVTSSETPSDELQLVYEANPTSGEITALTMTIGDIVPDSLRGAFLYTSASQEGIAKGNERPPVAVDIAVFQNSLFFAGTKTPQRAYATIIAVSGSNGIVLNDTVTIDSIVFTAKNTQNVSLREFQFFTGGSVSQNIEDTALSLVRVINQSASSTVYAYYLPGVNDLPGRILLEKRTGTTPFTVTVSRASAWSIPSSTSTNDDRPNGLAYSKALQPEHVPLTNYFEVGSRQTAITRIIALRDSLFVFKEDGVWRVSGDGSGGFQVTLFDSSAKLLAPESCAVLNNQVYCLSDQGVITVTETGVSVVSRPIEKELLAVQSASLASVRNLSWGVSYESDRKYYLGLISTEQTSRCVQIFVFNTFTNSWTRWDLSRSCAIVGSVDVRDSTAKELVYMADAASSRVTVERKNLNYLDHGDFQQNLTIVSTSGSNIVLSGLSDTVAIGDVIFQNVTTWAVVTAITTSTQTLTMSAQADFANGSVIHYRAIRSTIEWVPVSSQNPSILKQLHEAHFHYRVAPAGSATASFASDLSAYYEDVRLRGIDQGLWGYFDWDEDKSFGGDAEMRPLRVWVPRLKQACSFLNVQIKTSQGFSGFELLGVSIFGESDQSSRVRR